MLDLKMTCEMPDAARPIVGIGAGGIGGDAHLPAYRLAGFEQLGCGTQKGGQMARKRFTAEQIIGHLRQAEIRIPEGKTVAEVVREFGVSEQTYYRWRKEYGGMEVEQLRRLKELEQENGPTGIRLLEGVRPWG